MSDNKLALIDKNQLSTLANIDAEKWAHSLNNVDRKLAIMFGEIYRKKFREPLRKEEFLSSKNGDEMNFKIPGDSWRIKTSLKYTETTTDDVKDFDFKAAEEFAKKHGYNIPMTPEQKIVIPPCVNYEAMKNEKWFQDNIEQFMITKKITKTKIKGFDRIDVDFIKDEKENK